MTGIPPAPPPALITVDPDPMQAGQEAEICYAFGEGATSPVTLRITWNPAGAGSQDLTLSSEEPCKKISVPNDAKSVNIEDLSGQSLDFGGPVV